MCVMRHPSLLTVRAWIHRSEPRWRSMMTMLVWRAVRSGEMQEAVKISQCLTACQLDITAHSPSSPTACPPVTEPIQVNTSRRPAVSTLQLEPAMSTLPLLTVQLLTPRHFISVPALMDSGSSGNFISQALLKQLDLPRQRQAKLKIETIQGKPLRRGHIKFWSPADHSTSRLSSSGEDFLSGTGGTHRQYHSGIPLAISTFPEVRWDTSEIFRWSKTCIQNSLSDVPVTLVSNREAPSSFHPSGEPGTS